MLFRQVRETDRGKVGGPKEPISQGSQNWTNPSAIGRTEKKLFWSGNFLFVTASLIW